MNNNIFRLVFSKRLGMLVPASEMARSRSCKSPRRSRRRALAAMLALAPVAALAAQPAGLNPQLNGQGTPNWSGAVIDAARSSASQLTIRQNTAKAILNWQQLNLNRGESLIFDQQGNRSWAALNRIHDINPSTISGKVQADGHLYFVNTNGIIFGEGAQISVGSLTASSLDITDTLFTNGILSNPAAAFIGTGGFVRVEEGAAITAATGGRVMLLGKDVENSGIISTPDGQTILAAGERIVLTDSTDPAGLLVEVNAGGSATNLGEIVAQRGNVTLVGLAVNQEGRISASTSVRANGSVHLLARDNSGGGTLTMGQGSTTTVEVETDDKEEVLDAQALNPSRVELSGRYINIEGDIIAHGGEVIATAAANPLDAAATGDSRVYVGKQAFIDVSGVDAVAPMSRNQLEIQLFSEQLKDAPLLRGGALFGQKIYVDARKGTPLTDIAPFVALKGRTIAERLSKGGTVNLNASSQTTSPGDVVVRDGAVIDVSGGSITYEAGLIRESRLSYNGKLIPIAEATPDKPYQGIGEIYSVTDSKWGITRTWTLNSSPEGTFYQGYRDGMNAGAVNINAASAVLDGRFVAMTSPGATQRESLPLGGSLGVSVNNTIHVVQMPQVLPEGFAADDSLPAAQAVEVQFDPALQAAGFDHLDLTSSSVIVDAAIETGPHGSISLSGGGNVTINADMTVPGGDITISGGAVSVGDGVTISTAGLWTNDRPGVSGALAAPVALDGGNVAISGTVAGANALTFGAGSLVDASAGAWLTSGGTLKGGKGGNVSLGGVIDLQSGQVQAYGFSKGGQLSLSTLQDVQVGGQNPDASDVLWLADSFFQRGGFSKYSISASAADSDLLIGDAGNSVTNIHPQAQTLVARAGVGMLASGTAMDEVAKLDLPASQLRSPVSASFSAGGDLTLTSNAAVRTDAPTSSSGTKGAISLTAGGQLSILGDLIAPTGTISATISGSTSNFDYDNTLSLFVGETAKLLATGRYVVAPSNGSGLLDAEVLNGGSIALSGGERGVVVLKEGSLLDVSGVSGEADVAGSSGYTRQTLDGAAGSIGISARNGMVLDGDLQANASGTGEGGALTLAIKGSQETREGSTHPNGERVLTVTQDKTRRATGQQAGDALDDVIGEGGISAEQIADGGFDRLTLSVDLGVSGDRIVLPTGLNLDVPTALTLDTGLLEVTGNGTARVAASNMVLTSLSSGPAPVLGDAILEVDANFVDLANTISVTGVKSTQINSRLDIRGRGASSFSPGSLTVPGELVLNARQIYPVTNGQFNFEATGAGNRIEVQSSGETSVPVLSAGGRLSLKADEIVQGGVLRAPLGQITLDAANTLTLTDGSLTSVSADGQLIPYGLTRLGGLDWLAPTTDLKPSTLGDGLTAPSEKSINLKSADVNLAPGATVDISGSGDILAYEWIEGIGGSQDVLGQAGVYAVIPTTQGEYAPFDYNYQRTVDPANPDSAAGIPNELKLGDAIYISGMPGLAAGTYTLLPARYALLPGAFMVQTSGTGTLPGRSVAQLDGSTLVSGYLTTLDGGSRDALYSTFRITDGSIFRPAAGTISKAPAEYRLSTGNQFFSDLALDASTSIPRLASDAGQLVLNAGSSLTLGAELLTDKATGARGALVDVVSDKISVVSSIGADDGTLQLTADSLNALAADSLLLGGTRAQGTDGLNISTGATEVTFANDAAHTLVAAELIAAAKDTLTLQDGASVSTVASTQAFGSESLNASGDGALLAVSALNDLEFSRSGVAGAVGRLDIGSGATIKAHRSLVLDSTKTARLDGNVNVGSGGSATLGANRILLGSPDATLEGLRVDSSLLADLGDLSKVTLNSAQNLEIHGALSLGNSNLDLTLNTSGIKGVMAADESADIAARTFTLKNTTGGTSVASAGNGSLDVDARTIAIEGRAPTATGTSVIGIGGFETVNLAASGEAKLSGVGETQVNAGSATITSARMSAATGADYTIKVSGTLTTAAASSPATLEAVDGLGAKVKLQGSALTLGGKVELPSGQLTAVATSGDLIVVDGASIKASSVPVKFDRYTEYTPGGAVALQSDTGNVTVSSGAALDVSGGGDADAGKISISAVNGTSVIDGELLGTAGADGGAGGQFNLDVKTLGDLAALNGKLNGGGFTESHKVRVRTGDVAVSGTGNQALKARNVVVAADAGTVTVTGEIDATAASDGLIGLYGGTGVTLAGTADLKAVSTETGAEGGRVEIATTSGFLDLQAGSGIDVSGGAGGDGGTVHLRAPRNAANTDLNITAVVGDITGASAVRAEGFTVYTDSSIATVDISTTGAATTWYKQAESFMKSALVNSGVGLQRLGKLGDATFTIVPGLEIRNTSSDANIALANDWSLHNWRFDRDTGDGVTASGNLGSGLDADGHELLAGVLTMRAAGNLNLNNTLSDGFSSATLTTANTAQGLAAWSYNLVGGADFTAANFLATNRAASTATGNVTLANNKGIRTGTGDIRIAAGGDLTPGNDGSVIYTAGRRAESLAGFAAPTNSSYLTDGGDIDIRVQGNITGKIASAAGAQQLINQWLFRQGGGSQSKAVTWWLRPDLFKQGVAAFGGGDVTIHADGNITNFSASVPTTARYANDGSGGSSLNGGGDLLVSAGGDVRSGVYFAGHGDIRLSAGGSIGAATNTFGTTLALQDASAEVSAVNSAFIETVFNPTMWAQSITNINSPLGTTGDSSFFLTYGEDSAFRLDSLVGDVTLGLAKTGNITGDLASGLNAGTNAAAATLEIHPSTVEARAFGGDIKLGRLVMAPAADGNLSLLAAGDISTTGTALVALSDADMALLPNVAAPLAGSGGLGSAITQLRTSHAATPVHKSSGQPIVIVARDGSISLTGDTGSSTSAGPGLLAPKAVYLHAGKDIELNADIQHVSSPDISVIEAGRDFVMPLDASTQVSVSGPGELLVQAGRNVNLGSTKGIVTVADTVNAALPDEGASITVLAGLGEQGANVVDYIDHYIDPTGAGPAVLQDDADKLAEYRQATTEAVTTYVRKLTGDESLSDADAMAQYLALDEDQQAVLAYRHFSSELLASGKGFAESGSHDRGDNAIATLFPESRQYDGDLALFNSQIRTLRDGSVDILTPGGLINAGVPTSSGTDIGIVTEFGGDIRAFAETGFQVEQSRVITQYGSDITVWVNNGDIDAGRGSKSAVSVPERVVSTDADGNTTIEVKAAAVGSGIRAQTYDPDGPNAPLIAPKIGAVALIAPRGVLDAGEAGVAGGEGSVFIAPEFRNEKNFEAPAGSVPVADTSGLGGLSNVSNVASDATKAAAEDVARQVAQNSNPFDSSKSFLPSFINVEVIGLGDE